MKLIVVRHAESVGNLRRALDTGAPGSPLSDRGRQQAATLARQLHPIGPTAVFSSTAARARSTAEPLAILTGLQLHERAGLLEVSAGALELSEEQSAIDGYLSTIRGWTAGHLALQMPGGEDGHETIARFDAVIEEVSATGGTVVLVSHGGVIRVWASQRVRNLPSSWLAAPMLANTEALTFEPDGDRAWLLRRPTRLSPPVPG